MTSNGSIVIFTPLSNTIFAASGSTYILNSAAGVIFPPSKKPPPINTISSMDSVTLGFSLNTFAILVSGPSAHKVILSSLYFSEHSIIKSIALVRSITFLSTESSVPSSPVFPCTCSAVINFLFSGAGLPLKTGTSKNPLSSHIFSALTEVNSKGTFPATQVTPKTHS